MSENKPTTFTTKRYKRNIIIVASIVAAIVCLIAVAWFASLGDEPQKKILNDSIFTPTVTEVQDTNVQTDNTPEKACEFIGKYYASLAEKNVTNLQQMECEQAAEALKLGWLNEIGYMVDITKLGTPSRSDFPQSQGIYAGCTIYKISDFYPVAPTQAIRSNITGETGADGWVYFDSLRSKWRIADPTIPTATCAAEAKTVQRKSNDGLVTVKLSSPGAYCSPWWGYTQVSVEIENMSPTAVTFKGASYDDGITTMVPDELGNTVNPGEKKSGICIVYRGVLSGFGVEKIGGTPLMIDGNVCPLTISYGNEDISPVFAIGGSEAMDIVQLLTEQQIDDFNATSTGFDYSTAMSSSLIGVQETPEPDTNATGENNQDNGQQTDTTGQAE